jgi:cell wall-associated NlpC family hydrolase
MTGVIIERASVVAEARAWIGTKWVHQGRSAHGIDCVGLVVMVCRALTIWDYDVAGYPREPDGTFMSHFFAAGGVRIPLLSVQPGDLILFRDAIYACHVAVVGSVGDTLTLIHAHASRRKVVEEPLGAEWRASWVAGIQMPNVGTL